MDDTDEDDDDLEMDFRAIVADGLGMGLRLRGLEGDDSRDYDEDDGPVPGLPWDFDYGPELDDELDELDTETIEFEIGYADEEGEEDEDDDDEEEEEEEEDDENL